MLIRKTRSIRWPAVFLPAAFSAGMFNCRSAPQTSRSTAAQKELEVHKQLLFLRKSDFLPANCHLARFWLPEQLACHRQPD